MRRCEHAALNLYPECYLAFVCGILKILKSETHLVLIDCTLEIHFIKRLSILCHGRNSNSKPPHIPSCPSVAQRHFLVVWLCWVWRRLFWQLMNQRNVFKLPWKTNLSLCSTKLLSQVTRIYAIYCYFVISHICFWI